MRKVTIGGVALLGLVLAGWTALWLYASREAEHRLDGWLTAEAAKGRIWTCPHRHVGGFPFAITVDCLAPSYEGRTADRTDRAEAAALTAEAALTHPDSISVALRAPLTYRSGTDTDLTATWSHLELDLFSDTTKIHGTDVAVEGRVGAAGNQGGRAGTLDATFILGRDDARLDFAIAVTRAPIVALDALVGDQTPADITLTGRIDHAEPTDAQTPEQAIENWRRAGGRVTLTSSRIVRGASNVSASGTIGLDDAHRPQGRLAATFVGMEPILKRYGISANLAVAGALLNTLFGGGHKQAVTPSQPGALDLPISLQNGRLGIGPVRTPVQLQPLY